MELRDRIYPYPVLTQYNSDYTDSSFTTDISSFSEGKTLKIELTSILENEQLVQMLMDDMIRIVYHFECAQTGYRIARTTANFEYCEEISHECVNGRLQVCSFIVANIRIPEYVNKNFHSDYLGYKFDIFPGCILAVGNQFYLDVEMELHDLKYTPSVFNIIRNDDSKERSMLVEMYSRKIIIKLPEKDFYNYKSISKEVFIKSTLNSLVIIPTLVYVLDDIFGRSIEERNELNDYAWYKAIRKALINKFGFDIDTEASINRNSIEIAQKLIDEPITSSLESLVKGFKTTFDEEDWR